ncbi:hypothetical protein [Ensifer canadensis]
MGRLNPESALTMTVDFAQYQMLRPADAAKVLAITVTQLHSLAAHGEIRYVNVGTGVKRETRRYRAHDIQTFVEERTRTGTVKWSTRPPIEITKSDLFAAAKVIARDRKRREREKEWAALQTKRQKQRQETEAWLKQCEEEAMIIRERLALESIYGKGNVPPHMLSLSTAKPDR